MNSLARFFIYGSLSAAFVVCSVSCTVKTVSGDRRTVSVNGTGEVKIESDTATVSFSVITRAKEASTAAADNALKMTAVQNAVITAGCPKDAVTTQNYSIYQETNYDNGKQSLGDYRVSNEVVINLKDVTLVSKVIDAAVSKGANELSSISFGISNTEKPTEEARKLAAEQAHENAKILAESSGAKLGKLISINEEYEPDSPIVGRMMKAAAYNAMESAPTPVSSGNTAIRVTVNAVYELK
jgi:uncharacterized protein YggE